MSNVNWLVFFTGLAVGLWFVLLAAFRFEKDTLKILREYHEFFKQMREFQDASENLLRENFNSKIDIFLEHIDHIDELVQSETTTTQETVITLLEISRSIAERYDELKETTKNLSQNQAINDTRWELICEYFENLRKEAQINGNEDMDSKDGTSESQDDGSGKGQ